MATVTGLTKERMLEIESASIVSGAVLLDELILTRRDGTQINAGSVRGPAGQDGQDAAPGSVTPVGDTTPIRTADGRIKTATPTELDDAATMDYVGKSGGALKTLIDDASWVVRKTALQQRVLTGGGVRKVSSIGVSWSQRFLTMGAGREASTVIGYYEIVMPPNGTSIPVFYDSTSTVVTITNGVVPLGDWRALYYDVPAGTVATSDPARFKIVDYRTVGTKIPPTWLLIAVRNADTLSPMYMWGDGRSQDYWRDLILSGGWINYSGYAPAGYQLSDDGRVILRGLIANGATGTFTTLSASLTPLLRPIFTAQANLGLARIDVVSTGEVVLMNYLAGGTNAYLSLDGISWFAGA